MLDKSPSSSELLQSMIFILDRTHQPCSGCRLHQGGDNKDPVGDPVGPAARHRWLDMKSSGVLLRARREPPDQSSSTLAQEARGAKCSPAAGAVQRAEH